MFFFDDEAATGPTVAAFWCIKHRNVDTLTVVIKREVVLGVAEFLWATGDEDVVVPEEVLKASNLLHQKTEDQQLRSAIKHQN